MLTNNMIRRESPARKSTCKKIGGSVFRSHPDGYRDGKNLHLHQPQNIILIGDYAANY